MKKVDAGGNSRQRRQAARRANLEGFKEFQDGRRQESERIEAEEILGQVALVQENVSKRKAGMANIGSMLDELRKLEAAASDQIAVLAIDPPMQGFIGSSYPSHSTVPKPLDESSIVDDSALRPEEARLLENFVREVQAFELNRSHGVPRIAPLADVHGYCFDAAPMLDDFTFISNPRGLREAREWLEALFPNGSAKKEAADWINAFQDDQLPFPPHCMVYKPLEESLPMSDAPQTPEQVQVQVDLASAIQKGLPEGCYVMRSDQSSDGPQPIRLGDFGSRRKFPDGHLMMLRERLDEVQSRAASPESNPLADDVTTSRLLDIIREGLQNPDVGNIVVVTDGVQPDDSVEAKANQPSGYPAGAYCSGGYRMADRAANLSKMALSAKAGLFARTPKPSRFSRLKAWGNGLLKRTHTCLKGGANFQPTIGELPDNVVYQRNGETFMKLNNCHVRVKLGDIDLNGFRRHSNGKSWQGDGKAGVFDPSERVIVLDS